VEQHTRNICNRTLYAVSGQNSETITANVKIANSTMAKIKTVNFKKEREYTIKHLVKNYMLYNLQISTHKNL
jgi:hypothetical protein